MKEKFQENLLHNTTNLQTLENELSLTKQELEDFRKLPKEQQEKQKQDKLTKLNDLQNKLDQAIQEAIKTGDIDEAKNLKEQLEKEIQDLGQQIEASGTIKFPEVVKLMEIIPDPDIISAETAIAKLEAEGHRMIHKKELDKIDWKEELKGPYKIVSVSVDELFPDKGAYEYYNIIAKAKEFGLDLVPQKLLPTIFLNYKKVEGRKIIATKFIDKGYGIHQSLFYCDRNDSGSWSDTDIGVGGGWFPSESTFLFVSN